MTAYYVVIKATCPRCRYKLRARVVDGEALYWQCWRCGAWGFDAETMSKVILPKEAPAAPDATSGIETVIGSTGNKYRVAWKIDDGRRVATGCTCPAGVRHVHCKHQRQVEAA